MTLSGTVPHSCVRGSAFRYAGFDIDAERGVLSCRYELDGREFTERVTLASGPRWHTEAARAAARLVFLLAGVSYYKTTAPPVVDLGKTALTDAEHAFLREFYVQGLGEFAYRNALDLTSLRLEARSASPAGTTPPDLPAPGGTQPPSAPLGGTQPPSAPLGGTQPPSAPLGGPSPPVLPWGLPPWPHAPGASSGPWCRSAAGSTRSSRWSRSASARMWRCSW